MSVLQPIRVVLADDHAMVRDALAQILDECPGIRVVGQAASGREAIAVAAQTQPDVMVLDYSLPEGEAPTVIGSLLQNDPHLKVLVLTVHENIHYAVKIMECGAHGYVIKSAAMSELVAGIEAVHSGETYVSPKVSQRVIHHLRVQRKDRAGLDALSPREFDVLRMLGAGFSLTDCAAQLDISVSAASTYRARLMEKLNLQTTAQIIRFTVENGIVG